MKPQLLFFLILCFSQISFAEQRYSAEQRYQVEQRYSTEQRYQAEQVQTEQRYLAKQQYSAEQQSSTGLNQSKKVPTAKKTLLIIGDSLTEGYGVSKESAYPAQLQKLFDENQKSVKVINAGSSGSTTASLEKRLKWHLSQKPDYVMIALGANDGLRGFPIETSTKNLQKGIDMAQKSQSKVILAGMLLPMNFGEKYREQFENMYQKLVKKNDVVFIPFLLKDVGGIKELNIADGIHPNEKGYKIVAKTVYDQIKGLFDASGK